MVGKAGGGISLIRRPVAKQEVQNVNERMSAVETSYTYLIKGFLGPKGTTSVPEYQLSGVLILAKRIFGPSPSPSALMRGTTLFTFLDSVLRAWLQERVDYRCVDDWEVCRGVASDICGQ